MFRFLKTYKLGTDIAMAIVMTLTAFIASRDFIRTHDNWRLIVEIITGLIAMSKIVDVIEDVKTRKDLSSQANGN